MVLITREFAVAIPRETAWRHLAMVQRWPSWATHIKRVEIEPSGALGPRSKVTVHLKNGIRSKFAMVQFNPYDNWKWVGPFLWLTVSYDHVFVPIDSHQTKLIWNIEADGFMVSTLGRLFAVIYNRNLDRAIPLLVSELTARQRP